MTTTNALKDARLRIELDTNEAQAKLDALEERMEEITQDINESKQEMENQVTDTKSAARRRLSGLKPSRDTAKPGKFGIRSLPNIMSAQGMASAIPVIGGAASTAVAWELQYGALGQGLADAMGAKKGKPEPGDVGPSTGPLPAWMYKGPLTNDQLRQRAAGAGPELFDTHKALIEMDLRLRSFQPALEMAIEMAKATLMVGGHLNADQLKRFTLTAYEWEFVQARKDKDIRDKTIRMIASEAPGAIGDLFKQVVKGSFAP